MRRTRSILGRLEYGIWTPDEYQALQAEEGGRFPRPEMLILDQRRLESADQLDPSGRLPIIVLSDRAGGEGDAPRVIATLRQPAGVPDLYRVLQRHYEERPRTTPRVETALRATCRRKGRTWRAAIMSLSDNGCLLKSGKALPPGSEVSVSIDLENGDAVRVDAESAYQQQREVGLVFHAAPVAVRDRIGAFVLDQLAVRP